MKILTRVLNPPSLVAQLNAAGFPAEIRNLGHPDFHIFVSTSSETRDDALALVKSFDPETQVLD